MDKGFASSKIMRAVLIVCGFTALVLGLIGIILPVLPTTPFILLSALCFAKSSRRFHAMLLNNRYCGQIIREWENKRCIRRAVRLMAVGSIIFTFSLSIFLFIEIDWLRWLLALIGLILLAFLWRIPLCEKVMSNQGGNDRSYLEELA